MLRYYSKILFHYIRFALLFMVVLSTGLGPSFGQSSPPMVYTDCLDMGFSADGKHLAWLSRLGEVQIVEVASQEVIHRKVLKGANSLTWQGEEVLIARPGELVMLRSPFRSQRKASLPAREANLATARDYLGMIDERARLRVFRWPAYEQTAMASGIQHMSFAGQQKYLATATGAVLKVLDPATGKTLSNLVFHKLPVTALSASPNPDSLASADASRIVLWHLPTFEAPRAETFYALEDQEEVRSLAHHWNNKGLAAGMSSGLVRVWVFAFGEYSKQYEAGIQKILIQPGANQLAVLQEDGKLIIEPLARYRFKHFYEDN